MDDVSQMMQNHEAQSWSDIEDDDSTATYDDERASPIERLESYIDHCFDAYPIVSRHLDRQQVQACVADWGRRRGQARYNTHMKKQKFGKQVRDSKWREHMNGSFVVFIAEALVGVPPEEDKGVGWKPCVRHELGHIIDYQKRGTSGHDRAFKAVMAEFGEDANDGGHAHGWAPRRFR
jgi:hypothetical protein